MAKLDRRTFIQFLSGFTAVIGLRLPSQDARPQKGSAKPRIQRMVTDVAVIGADPSGYMCGLAAAKYISTS